MSTLKVVRCREVGFDCEGVVRAETEAEVLNRVADHARTVHNVKEITDDIVRKVKSVMFEENDNSFRVIARLRAKDGKESELKNILKGLVVPTRNEPGNISYELFQNKENPGEFTFVEKWRDDKALNGHFETNHIKKALQKLPDVLAEEMDLRKYEVIG